MCSYKNLPRKLKTDDLIPRWLSFRGQENGVTKVFFCNSYQKIGNGYQNLIAVTRKLGLKFRRIRLPKFYQVFAIFWTIFSIKEFSCSNLLTFWSLLQFGKMICTKFSLLSRIFSFKKVFGSKSRVLSLIIYQSFLFICVFEYSVKSKNSKKSDGKSYWRSSEPIILKIFRRKNQRIRLPIW